MNIPTEYAFETETGEMRPILGVQGLHQLAFRLLKLFITSKGYEYTDQGRAQFVMDLVDEHGVPGKYRESVEQIANVIYFSHPPYKNRGRNKMNSRQRNSIIFVFKTTLLIALERCK